MGKVKNYMMDVQEVVWDFFDADGLLIDQNATTADVINAVKKAFPNSTMAIEIAEKEIFDIQTGDQFSY